jgi:uncharacterized protein YukE
MPNNLELFVNSDQIKALANQIKTLSLRMNTTLSSISTEIMGTDSTYESQSASDLRERFTEVRSKLNQFYEYLIKVSTYLVQNVAEPAEVVEQVSINNVAAIKKPH